MLCDYSTNNPTTRHRVSQLITTLMLKCPNDVADGHMTHRGEKLRHVTCYVFFFLNGKTCAVRHVDLHLKQDRIMDQLWRDTNSTVPQRPALSAGAALFLPSFQKGR